MLANEDPDRTAKLKKKLVAWRYNVLARMPIPNPAHDSQRADQWWSVGSGKPLDSDNRSRFPYAEKDE